MSCSADDSPASDSLTASGALISANSGVSTALTTGVHLHAYGRHSAGTGGGR